MPSTSPKQARFMRAVAHGFKPDKVQSPPRKVAEEFMHADMRKAAARQGAKRKR